MKIKVSEATGPTLDWLVAQIENAAWAAYDQNLEADVSVPMNRPSEYLRDNIADSLWRPSTDWAQGGPILGRETISLDPYHDYPRWAAACPPESGFNYFGPTPLIAAMRCLVASKLGEEVEVPDELS